VFKVKKLQLSFSGTRFDPIGMENNQRSANTVAVLNNRVLEQRFFFLPKSLRLTVFFPRKEPIAFPEMLSLF